MILKAEKLRKSHLYVTIGDFVVYLICMDIKNVLSNAVMINQDIEESPKQHREN